MASQSAPVDLGEENVPEVIKQADRIRKALKYGGLDALSEQTPPVEELVLTADALPITPDTPQDSTPPLQYVRVKTTAVSFKLPVLGVSVSKYGVALLLPPNMEFDMAFESVIDISCRETEHKFIPVFSTGGFYTFPSMPGRLLCFLRIKTEDVDDD